MIHKKIEHESTKHSPVVGCCECDIELTGTIKRKASDYQLASQEGSCNHGVCYRWDELDFKVRIFMSSYS
jgi:hypothetical protein